MDADADRYPGRSAVPLARWLREAASGDLALRAARTAFAQTLSIADFYAARAPAGKAWPAVRRALLAALLAAERAHDRVEILMQEGLIDEAVAAAGSGGGTGEAVLLRLAEAAHARHPAWVIRLCEGRAARLMDRGSAGLYAEAAHWLEQAARAYDAAGRVDDWSVRIEALIETHKRKYKLRPMLEALRFDPRSPSER